MVEWNRRERGVQTERERFEHWETYDYDGLSCMALDAVSGHTMRDVEDLTMLSGLRAEHETEEFGGDD